MTDFQKQQELEQAWFELLWGRALSQSLCVLSM